MTPVQVDPNAILVWISIALGVVNLGTILYAISKSGEKKNAADIEELRKELNEVQRRLEALPARQEFHGLSISVATIAGDMKAVQATIEGISKFMGRLERVVTRQEDFLLEKGGK